VEQSFTFPRRDAASVLARSLRCYCTTYCTMACPDHSSSLHCRPQTTTSQAARTCPGAWPSLAVVKASGNGRRATVGPVTTQWSSPPQSPWSTQSASGSLGEARRKKSWSLWNCDGNRAGDAYRLAGAKMAPDPMA
jgi:hypothetical protein